MCITATSSGRHAAHPPSSISAQLYDVPIRRTVSKDDTNTLKMLDGSTWYIDLARKLERPGFVDEQMRRLDWYPVRVDGTRADPNEVKEWAYFGQFLGELDVSSLGVTYRYVAADGGGGVRLRTLGGSTITTV
jgi:hypothetical protein